MAEAVMKVLLIEDERDILECIVSVLQNLKRFQVFTAMNARQGVEIAKQEKPDVILMDLRMPGMSGEEALRELRPVLTGTKFIVMTGWDDGQTKERILTQIGVDAYFDKPFELEKVIDKVLELASS